MSQGIEVPLIGQTNQMVATLRLQLASQVLCQLAATDYAQMSRAARDKDEATGGDGTRLEFGLNTGMVANAAAAYADGLLIALGVIRPAK